MEAVLAALQLITEPPGDIVYFLVTLFALQQAWVTAITSPQANARRTRWQWASSLMLLQRATLIILGLLGNSGLVSTLRYLPVLESLTDVSSALLIAWAALFTDRERKEQTWVLAVLLTVFLGFFFITSAYWLDGTASTDPYTITSFALVWNTASLLIVGITMVSAVLIKPAGWDWLVGLCLFWLLGGAAQTVLYPLASNHLSGWQRLASLITYPLLAILVQRQLLFLAPVAKVPEVQESLHEPTVNLLHNIQSARDVEPALIVASSQMAQLLKAKVCVVLLQPEQLSEETAAQAPHLRVVAVHPPNDAQLDTPAVLLDDYPLLKDVLEEKLPIVLRGDKELAPLCPMSSELGIMVVDTLTLVPLQYRGRNWGIMLVGDSSLNAPIEVIGKLGVLMGAAIAAANETTPQGDMMQRVTSNIALAAGASGLTSQLESKLNEQIEALHARLKTREEEVNLLNVELQNLTQHTSVFEQQIWQEEIRKLADEREFMEKQVKDLNRDRDLLLSERDHLSNELEELRAELDTLTAERDQYRAQVQDLMESQAAHNAIVQSGTVGLLIADADGSITMADALARKLLQLPDGNVVGIPLNGAFANPYWTQAVDNLLSAESTESAVQLTLDMDDEIIEAELSALHGHDLVPDGIAVVLRSSESSAELFVSIINQASEFRTPMTAITGYTDLLLGEQGGILTNMQRQFLERVKANVEQLNHQLNDLLRLTSPDRRPVELSPQPVNLIEIIEEAIMGLAARFRERKLAVQLDLPPELARVRADRDSLYQIMVRLISNAALCSEQGSQILISAVEDRPDDDPYVRISVTDTGSGIAPEDFPRVFRKFYRANQPTIQGMGETGIGMAVAKTLVEANNGRIWVESTVGKGSTFSFLLPAEPAETTETAEEAVA